MRNNSSRVSFTITSFLISPLISSLNVSSCSRAVVTFSSDNGFNVRGPQKYENCVHCLNSCYTLRHQVLIPAIALHNVLRLFLSTLLLSSKLKYSSFFLYFPRIPLIKFIYQIRNFCLVGVGGLGGGFFGGSATGTASSAAGPASSVAVWAAGASAGVVWAASGAPAGGLRLSFYCFGSGGFFVFGGGLGCGGAPATVAVVLRLLRRRGWFGLRGLRRVLRRVWLRLRRRKVWYRLRGWLQQGWRRRGILRLLRGLRRVLRRVWLRLLRLRGWLRGWRVLRRVWLRLRRRKVWYRLRGWLRGGVGGDSSASPRAPTSSSASLASTPSAPGVASWWRVLRRCLRLGGGVGGGYGFYSGYGGGGFFVGGSEFGFGVVGSGGGLLQQGRRFGHRLQGWRVLLRLRLRLLWRVWLLRRVFRRVRLRF